MMGQIRRLAQASIWGSKSVDMFDQRMKMQLRYGYPIYDVFMATFGVFSAIGGTPALRQTFGESYATLWGFTVASSALIALAGVAFPAVLFQLEFYAKCFLIGLLSVYAFAIILAGTFGGDIGRSGVGFALLGMAVLPTIRIADIARDKKIHEWGKRIKSGSDK